MDSKKNNESETHFIGLKNRFHFLLHSFKRFKSCNATESPTLVMRFRHFVSSAKRCKVEEKTEDGIIHKYKE